MSTWARPADLDLTVVTMRGWWRGAWWDCTGRPWMAPSPAIPDPDTALAYLATVYLEGTKWSEGRGTRSPFTVVAGPERPITVSWSDREIFRPVATGVRLLEALCQRDGPRWRDGGHTLDLLFGSAELRERLERGHSVEPLIQRGLDEAHAFAVDAASSHLYPPRPA